MTSRDFTALANSLPFYQDPTGGSRAAPQYSGRVPNSMPANLNMVSLEPTNPAVTGLGSRIGDGDTSSNSAASVLPNFLGNLMKGFEQARAATGAGNNRTILPGMRPDSPNISPGTVIDGAMNSGTIPEDVGATNLLFGSDLSQMVLFRTPHGMLLDASRCPVEVSAIWTIVLILRQCSISYLLLSALKFILFLGCFLTCFFACQRSRKECSKKASAMPKRGQTCSWAEPSGW
eukprot:GHVT01080111.1.p1 GENE.GHVT01080111.1~~GHVT01080111.1.p1  ORF type:complete len:233 (+),score=8.37 GHVT01080111.1:348-1046(+)